MRVSDFARIQVYIAPEQHAQLKALSELLGRSASGLLNEAFDRYLEGLSNTQRHALDTVLEVKRSMREGAAS